ncbi:MAG: type I restriction enzyme HsdR N-terminal domain-containing protein, partial [Nitrospinae bacterium]|nr:type I restriction enzyme HsdR N-terminal domain-containing protein [Nitrospinota bacterium]
MIKIPLKFKKNISAELKRFTPIIQNLRAKGTSTSEDDSRIILNDILSDVLGYDKYNELRTEQREKAGRLDYVIKLTEGPFANKKDKSDCVVEAKAIHHDLVSKYVDQTLTYCLTTNTTYFILTNVRQWRLYKVKPARKNSKPSAELIHEVDFTHVNNLESLTEDFYIFSRASYLAGDWNDVATLKKA